MTPILYTYDRRKSPLLPLSDGGFRFLHRSNNRKDRLLDFQIVTAPLGTLSLPSGRLLVTDPFVNLAARGQIHVQAPAGEWPVFQTLCREAGAGPKNDSKELEVAVAMTGYLSIVFDTAAMERRRAWQAEQAAQQLDPALRREWLVRLVQSADGRLEDDGVFDDTDEFAGLLVQSGAVMLTDLEQFQEGMPDESRGTWYSTLFEHGNHESWFSYMDRPEHYREGAANFPLPLRPRSRFGVGNLILSQTGWGDGQFVIFAELDPKRPDIQHPVAYHIDFEVIPQDPLRPALKKAR